MPTPTIRWKEYPVDALSPGSELARQWDQLNAQRGDLPFLSADAIINARRAFGSGQERLLCGHVASDLVAMFMLVPAGRFRWQTFQPSQIPLGAWVAGASFSIDELAQSLIKGPLGLCLALSITQIDPLVAARNDDSGRSTHADYIETGWIDIEGSFQDYWEARGKNLRQNLRKQRNRLAADGVNLDMRVLRGKADVAPALERYGQLESAGWKAAEGTAIHPDNAQGRFYSQLFEHAAGRGESVIYEYLFDGRVVAMNLCLLRGHQLVILKTAYDESIKSLSPAFLLMESELQAFFADQEVTRVEFFGRLMDWHTKWTENKRSVYHLTWYRFAWVKTLANRRRK